MGLVESYNLNLSEVGSHGRVRAKKLHQLICGSKSSVWLWGESGKQQQRGKQGRRVMMFVKGREGARTGFDGKVTAPLDGRGKERN